MPAETPCDQHVLPVGRAGRRQGSQGAAGAGVVLTCSSTCTCCLPCLGEGPCLHLAGEGEGASRRKEVLRLQPLCLRRQNHRQVGEEAEK